MRNSNPFFFLSDFLHRYFILLLIVSYFAATFYPAFGLTFGKTQIADFNFLGKTTSITLTMLLLALILLNAGLGVEAKRFKELIYRPQLLIGGLIANMILPILFIYFVSSVMHMMPGQESVTMILIGLLLVSSVPIAGAATAWTQNANGDLALSLGLVFASTLISPLTTPLMFSMVGSISDASYSQALSQLQGNETRAVLLCCVILPSLLGLALRKLIGASRIDAAKGYLKLMNYMSLLLLNYANASVSLPEVLANSSWQFFIVTIGLIAAMCLIDFTTGWWLAGQLRGDRKQRTAMMFGLGMNNNGTALVLATMVLADKPLLLLPIVLYSLVQHLFAGGANFFVLKPQLQTLHDSNHL